MSVLVIESGRIHNQKGQVSAKNFKDPVSFFLDWFFASPTACLLSPNTLG